MIHTSKFLAQEFFRGVMNGVRLRPKKLQENKKDESNLVTWQSNSISEIAKTEDNTTIKEPISDSSYHKHQFLIKKISKEG